MFDTIILLTDLADEAALSALLRGHNPSLSVRRAGTLADLEAITPRDLARARLIGFLTSVVVPTHILDALGYGAYNFHPGPPNYPGWVPCHFATYDGVRTYGVTAHHLAARVDSGPIVGHAAFDVPPGTGVTKLEEMATKQLARLFWTLGKALATQAAPLHALPLRWSGRKTTRRLYASLCEIPIDITKDELDRRLAVFGAGHFGVTPAITLHGYRFRYEGAGGAPADLVTADAPATAPA
jgi:methionyl-tRNA formyltransferase